MPATFTRGLHVDGAMSFLRVYIMGISSVQDYDSEHSGSRDGATHVTAGQVRSGARALLYNLRNALEGSGSHDEEVDVITEQEPTNALVMKLGSSHVNEMCRAALGPFFDKAYWHCKTRYIQDGVDMQDVHEELLCLVDLPMATKRGAVQQLEMLVYHELFTE